jgi:peptidoglycan-N-acetylglucosamine deacetylase
MKNHTILIILGILVLIGCNNSPKVTEKIAITFDDLPTLSHGLLSKEQQAQYFYRIVDILDKYEIKCLGFVLGKLVNNENKQLLSEFCRRGHELGNHSYNHYDLNKVSSYDYCTDIMQGGSVVDSFQCSTKYFRYPLLHRGNKQSKKDSVSLYLDNNGYIVVPVSIDNDEVMFNLKFVKAFVAGDTLQAGIIGEEYLKHMISKTRYYDQLALQINGKQIPHILLLHMNFINSFYLDELIEWYISDNREFISVDEALKDPFYEREDKYIGNKGLSFIERLE